MNWNQSQSEHDQAQHDELAEALKVARFEATWKRHAQAEREREERGRAVLVGYIVVAALALTVGLAIGLSLRYIWWP